MPTGGRILDRVPTSWWISCLILIVGIAGCRSAAKKNEDSEVRRHAEAAHKAFSIGYDETAVVRYRRAVRRAWAIDDARLIGRHAYNLAAANAAMGHFREARDWLAEARVELTRAGEDTLKTQVLQAHIARQQGFFDEAYALTVAVERAVEADEKCRAKCKKKRSECEHCNHEGDTTFAGVTSVAAVISHFEYRERKQPEDRRDHAQSTLEKRASEIQVHLLRALLAADQMDLATASDQVAAARRKLRPRVDHAVAAEVERVEGRILALAGEYGPAAARFDEEARRLRMAESYREIPMAYRSAAEAYEMAGLMGMAVDRYIRAARMLYAREAFLPALWCIDRALPIALSGLSPDLEGRLALVFNEIARAVEATAPRDRRKVDGEPVDPLPPGAWQEVPDMFYDRESEPPQEPVESLILPPTGEVPVIPLRQ